MAIVALLIALLCHLSCLGTADGAANPLTLTRALKRAGVVDIVGNQAQLFAEHAQSVVDQVAGGMLDPGGHGARNAESQVEVSAAGAMFAGSARPRVRRLAEEDEVVEPGRYSAELPPLSTNCSGFGFLVDFTEPAYFCNDTRVSQEFYEAVVGSDEEDGTGPFPDGFEGAFADGAAFADAFGGGGSESLNATANSTANATADGANGTNSSSNASEPATLVCEIRQVPVPTCICPLERTGDRCETQRSSSCAVDIVPESLQPPSRAAAYAACVRGGPLAAAALDYDTDADGDKPCLVVDREREEVVAIPIALTCAFEVRRRPAPEPPPRPSRWPSDDRAAPARP